MINLNRLATLLSLAAMMLTLPVRIQAQTPTVNGSSLDVVVDPVAVALGESFTGKHGSLSGFEFNPATVAGIAGPEVFYGFRNQDYLPPVQSQFTCWKGAIPFSFGTIAFSFQQYEQPVTSYVFAYNYLIYGNVGSSDYTAAIGFARSLGKNWDLGIAIKEFQGTIEFSHIPTPISYQGDPSFVADLGMIYHSDGPIGETAPIRDEFSCGASIQNFGSNYMIKYLVPVANGSTNFTNFDHELPHYGRVGISYSLASVPSDEGGTRAFAFNFSGEYRNVLSDYYAGPSEKDYWGFGLESTLYDLVSIRLGGYIPGATSVYGTKGVPSMRYGAGLNLPFRRIGISSPLELQFNYSAIPANVPSFYYTYLQPNTTMRAYSLTLRYDGRLLGGSTDGEQK